MKKIICTVILLALFCSCTNTVCFSEIVEKMGYEPETQPYEIVTVTIPSEFNNVYRKYNELQKQGGFDLEPYKGKTCTRYTYLIPSIDARANVLVYDGKVIGGDICGITLDGVMLPLKNRE